jgi:hypothetical protein
MHMIENLRVIGDFSDDFDPRLIRKRAKKQLPHELGPISHENTDCLVHGHLLSGLET